jgi:type I restriction enzyme, S subunit
MNNTSTGSVRATKKIIPELRFPEFAKEGEWKEKRLEKVCKINPRITQLPRRFVYIDLESVKNGTLLKKEIISSEGAPSRAQRLLNNDDVIFQMVRPYQKNNYYFLKEDANDYVASTGYAQLRAFESSMYLYQFIHTDRFVTSVLVKCTGSNYPAINSSDLSQILVQIPSPKEQKKIASCLSSLDDLITAHSQKLDALKDHKKGLMQNLFPQKGKTVPKYRFPEFVNEGEWVVDILINIAENGFSNGVFNDPKKVGTGYKLINVINMYTESTINENDLSLLEISKLEFEKNKVEWGDIFFTRSSLVAEGIAKSNIYLGFSKDITFDGHLIRMRPKKELIDQVYLHYLLKTNKIRSQMIAKGKTATMTTIGQSDVASVDISYTLNPKEQKKIAACFSSLDVLITAQADKIEQLKLHKKGLMQGLFLTPEAKI